MGGAQLDLNRASVPARLAPGRFCVLARIKRAVRVCMCVCERVCVREDQRTFQKEQRAAGRMAKERR